MGEALKEMRIKHRADDASKNKNAAPRGAYLLDQAALDFELLEKQKAPESFEEVTGLKLEDLLELLEKTLGAPLSLEELEDEVDKVGLFFLKQLDRFLHEPGSDFVLEDAALFSPQP